VRFVLDNNLPPKLAEILRIAGSDVVHLREHCDGRGDVPDVEWMHDLATRKWIAITYDRQIQAKPNERSALLASGLTIIFVTNTVQTLSHKQQLAFFIGHWDNAEEAAANARPHKCWFLWQANGKVKPYNK
jgi:uncharacterized protein with PIN domain